MNSDSRSGMRQASCAWSAKCRNAHQSLKYVEASTKPPHSSRAFQEIRGLLVCGMHRRISKKPDAPSSPGCLVGTGKRWLDVTFNVLPKMNGATVQDFRSVVA